ncbi:MAG: DNA-binding domain-containing protein [Mogibacterium sp.]|nr:DNA-binding domain-containing protein [Mogibacterium sp.]
MRYYIVDDNIATVKTLENILRKRDLGEVAGTATDPLIALQEIPELRPDIVLVDLLMSGIDGITLVSRIREVRPEICFVMISKVTDKEMVQQAYRAGIEFFISKPVNLIEVERVLGNVAERVRMRSIMSNIRNMFDEKPEAENRAEPELKRQDGKNLDILFGNLGMLGERGVQDIRLVFRLMQENRCDYDKKLLEDAAAEQGDTVKNVEQRIRRAVKKGLTNAASAGIDDFGNDSFVIYANYVFDFMALREEMSYLQGKSATGGRVSIPKFMDGLMLYSKCVD